MDGKVTINDLDLNMDDNDDSNVSDESFDHDEEYQKEFKKENKDEDLATYENQEDHFQLPFQQHQALLTDQSDQSKSGSVKRLKPQKHKRQNI